MAARVWPVDVPGGAPLYSGRILRQSMMAPLLAGARADRPLGARSGVRPGTPASTVSATSTVWTVRPHAGILDTQAAAEAGPYGYAFDEIVTGAVTAANATNPRIDILSIQLSDPAESDGSTTPGADVVYTAGTAAASPSAPATPARSITIAQINVPASGGGAPTVTWVAPYCAAAGSAFRVRTKAEADALVTTYTPTSESPLWVEIIGSSADAGTVMRHNGSGWVNAIAPATLMPAPKVAPGAPGQTQNNGTPTAGGNLIRDDVLGAYTFTALAGYQYRIVCDGVLLNGSAVNDVFSIQLRIAAGTDAPGGSATAVAATQATVTITGSAGRQPIDLGGPWTCPATGVYSAAFFMQRSQGTGFGTPVSAVANRSLYAVLEHQVAS